MGYKLKRITIRPNGTEQQIRPKLIPATAITLNESLINMKTIGDTYQLVATLTPADSTSSVTWSSDDTSIATVDNTGLVTCVTPGECTITAETDNGLTASCDVTNKRTPGANTIAYYPLNSTTTVNDMSGNNRTLSSYNPYGGVDFGIYNNVDCCYFGDGGTGSRLFTKDIPDISTGTVIFYSANNYPNGFSCIVKIWFSLYSVYLGLSGLTGNNGVQFGYPNRSSSTTNVTISTSRNTWDFWAITKSAGTYKLYKNGTLYGSYSGYNGSSSGSSGVYIGQDGTNGAYSYDGSISELIIEDKVWTASEIQDYFNNTKSIYGIS